MKTLVGLSLLFFLSGFFLTGRSSGIRPWSRWCWFCRSWRRRRLCRWRRRRWSWFFFLTATCERESQSKKGYSRQQTDFSTHDSVHLLSRHTSRKNFWLSNFYCTTQTWMQGFQASQRVELRRRRPDSAVSRGSDDTYRRNTGYRGRFANGEKS